MAQFIENLGLKWQVGLETDIGGGRENQDECFVWMKKDDGLIVLCVLDGHGREVGRVAAESAKSCLFQYLDDNYRDLIESPAKFLVKCHEVAHENIKMSFKLELENQGFEVQLSEEKYLLKRKPGAEQWVCIHGGTSCSMVALVGQALYIANVGDSTGILCSTLPVFEPSCVQHIMDAALAEPPFCASGSVVGAQEKDNLEVVVAEEKSSSEEVSRGDHKVLADSNESKGNSALTNTLVITAEHSPESAYEYRRLRKYRSRAGDASLPALVVVYDSNSHDKTSCSSVFRTESDGTLTLTNKGSYYKNVRKEWASLVSTPSYARFQDALAFTRSLGDLHLHTYGVTHLPEVQTVDLAPIFRRLSELSALKSQATANSSADGAQADQEPSSPAVKPGASSNFDKGVVEAMGSATLCLVLCTDGVWDNWLYEDVTRFVVDPSCLCAVAAAPDGARRVTMSFMQRNASYSKRNFGSQADNATGIVVYFSVAESFPAL